MKTLLHAKVRRSCESENVSNMPYNHVRPTSVTEAMNIRHVKDLIVQKGQIKVYHIACIRDIGVTNVYTNIHDRLEFCKVCTRRVPRMLTFNQKIRKLVMFLCLLIISNK